MPVTELPTSRPAGAGGGRARHVPERRCVGCGTRAPKGALARFAVVRGGDGAVLVRDDRAVAGGRGVYVCRREECFQRAVKRNAFARGARMGGTRVQVDPALGSALGREG
ncbi:MAG: YlxR family protein [Actinomycetota bacterium]